MKISRLFDFFERTIVFLLSRTMYSVSAGFAFASLCIAILAMLFSLSPTIHGFAPSEPESPGDPGVSQEEVLAQLPKDPEPIVDLKPTLPSTSEVPQEQSPELVVDTHAEEIEALVEEIKAHFPTQGYPWKNKTQTYCKRYWYGSCKSWGTRVLSQGAHSVLMRSVERLDRSSQIPYLEQVVDAMPLLDDESGRFVLIGTFSDVQVSFPAYPREALEHVLFALGKPQPPAPEGQENREFVDLDAGVKTVLLESILHIKKSGRPDRDFVHLMPSFSQLVTLAEERQQYLVEVVWEVWGMVPADRKQHHHDELMALIESCSKGDRVEAALIYRRLYRQKVADNEAEYRKAQMEFELALQKIDSDYQISVDAKREWRGWGFTWSGYSLGALAALGLLLSLFAIERNTRKLERVLDALTPDSETHKEPSETPAGSSLSGTTQTESSVSEGESSKEEGNDQA